MLNGDSYNVSVGVEPKTTIVVSFENNITDKGNCSSSVFFNTRKSLQIKHQKTLGVPCCYERIKE